MDRNNLAFEIFSNFNFTVAENPLWNEDEQKLYWKGWNAGQIYRKSLDCKPTDFETFDLPVGFIGGFVFTYNHALLIFAQHGRVWRWQPGSTAVKIGELPEADDKTCFNDLIVDPEGRVFVGVLGHDFFNLLENPDAIRQPGSLWLFDPDGSFHCLEPKTGLCPNGMAFSRDLKYFYFSVTDENTVYRYEYDRVTDSLSCRTPFINSKGCDGITVDTKNRIWIAQSGILSGHGIVMFTAWMSIPNVIAISASEAGIFILIHASATGMVLLITADLICLLFKTISYGKPFVFAS